MTLEFYYYIFLVLLGLAFCFIRIKSNILFFILYLFSFTIFSIITRYSGFDIDMNTYASALNSDSFVIYYLKEPVYWILSRYIYDIVKSPEITFIIFDIISFIFIYNASKNMKMPNYFPFLFILIFPSVMGINNVYRQYLTYSFFLYFISLFFTEAGNIKKIFFLILSILTHNVAALFSPFFFTFNKHKRLSFKALILFILIIFLLPYAISTKSFSDSGVLGVEVYILILMFIIIFYSLSYRLKFNGISAKLFYFLIYMLILLSTSSIFMGNAQSKRVGMFILMISLIPLVKSIEENYKQRIFLRCMFYLMVVLPTFIFYSSRSLLMT